MAKRTSVFNIIKENMINILTKWSDEDKSVIWILCESTDLTMQYTTLKQDCEEKWNIAFYDDNEEEIFTDKNNIKSLEDLLFNNGCNIDDLMYDSDYFTDRMIKIIKELRKEGYISDETAVILSDLEISYKTLEIAKKINKAEAIKEFIDSFENFDDINKTPEDFVNEFMKITNELRKEGYISDEMEVLLSDKNFEDKLVEISKKINKKSN